jgi:catechol 2,3-dioxygenase-like lactoylglutathione lyase family enzyme
LRIDHVQLAIPPGAEDECRRFYVGLLGLRELTKPPALAARGGVWVGGGSVQIHLGVEQDFRPARKAHPGLEVTDLDRLAARLEAHGFEVRWDAELPRRRRFYTDDPAGNRLEFLAPAGAPEKK